MVTIKIFIEGGVHPNNRPDAATIDNTTFLRQSFNRLFNSAFPNEKVKIDCKLCASYTSAVWEFIHSHVVDDLLLIDLEGAESTREKKLEGHELIPMRDRVFFMVQKMESWILSQPMQIQRGLANYYHKSSDINLQDDPMVFGIDVQTLSKPDQVLDHLLRKHFQELKGDTPKPLKYGKLKNSYRLIELLSVEVLKEHFVDVQGLLSKISERVQ